MSEALEVGGDESPTYDLCRLPTVKFADDGLWRDHALCKSMGTLTFFGEMGKGIEAQRRIRKKRAVAICRACTVRKECFNYAKQNDERYGIWGGIDFTVSSKRPLSMRVIPDSID